jgi:hypothetical protein
MAEPDWTELTSRTSSYTFHTGPYYRSNDCRGYWDDHDESIMGGQDEVYGMFLLFLLSFLPSFRLSVFHPQDSDYRCMGSYIPA